MAYLPQSTSPLLIPLPTWKTRFLFSCFHSSHILCHRPELWILLLWGDLTHPPSKLGSPMLIYLCNPVAGCISQPQWVPWLFQWESQSSSQEAVRLVWRNTSCYYQPSFVLLRSRQKHFMFHVLNLSTTLQCPSLVKLCLLFIPRFYQQRLTFFSCEAALLQRKAQHWDGFSLLFPGLGRSIHRMCSWWTLTSVTYKEVDEGCF